MTKHFFRDTAVLTGRSLRHITAQPGHHHHDRDHADRHHAAVRLRVRRRDQPGVGSYVNYLLPGILLITIASGIAYTAFRLFTDM